MQKLFTGILLIVTSWMSMFPVGLPNHVSAQNVPASQGIAYSSSEKLASPMAPAMELWPSSSANGELAISQEWMFAMYGSGIGVSGLIAQDLNGDGTVEIVAGGNSAGIYAKNNFWYVLRQSGPNAYDQIWASDPFIQPINQIEVMDVDNDGVAEIFVGLDDASVHVYRGTDFSQIASFTTKYNTTSMLFADADGDGFKELITSSYIFIAAYNPLNYQLLWECSGYEGDLAVGNVDADATPEIVLSSGYVLDGATREVEWDYSAGGGFGAQVEVGDVDGDSIGEIIGAAAEYKITVFEADLRSPVWDVVTKNEIAVLVLADVNGDGYPEILYGDSHWYGIHCIDGIIRQELWMIKNPDHGVTAITVGNVDQDASLEVLWGSGFTSTAGDYLFIADILSGEIEWQNEDLDGPLSAVGIGDVDDDGQVEIVMASHSSDSGYRASIIKIFNAVTHEVEWQTISSTYDGINSIRVGDVDQDGETEFVIATSVLAGGAIQIFNGHSHTLERQSQTYFGSLFTAMEIADVDGDAQTEIVIGQVLIADIDVGIHVIVFDGATAEEEWQSMGLDTHYGEVYDVHLEDVDGDSRVEIIASLRGSSVYVFDGITHVMEALIPTDAYAIFVGDIDQDNTRSILVGRSDGRIDFYNGKTFALEATISLGNAAISCLSLTDVDQDAIPDWLICASNRLSVYSTEDFSLRWRSQDLGSSLGKYNQAPAGQIDQDNNLEILVGSMIALYQFESPSSGPLAYSYMTVSSKNALPGDSLTYTIVLLTRKNDDFLMAQVDNPLPSALSYVPDTLSVSRGTAAYEDGRITWNGDLNERNSVTLSYQVNVKQDVPRISLVNSAQVISGGFTKVISTRLFVSPSYLYMPVCSLISCSDFIDTFQNPSSGWPVGDSAQMKTEYVGGEYRILGKDTRYVYLIKAPTCKRQNYTVEVDARWAGNLGAGYGLVFGLVDDFSQYYMLMVNTDYQDYSLYYYGPSGFEEIVSNVPSLSISSGSALNHLKVTRSGSQIFLAINGSIQGTWTDTRISGQANVGLLNVPYSNLANADARFDNFKVTTLHETSSGLSNVQNLAPSGMITASGDELYITQAFQGGRPKPEN